MVTTLEEEEEFACGDSNHPFFPPLPMARRDNIGDGDANGGDDDDDGDDEDDFDDLYSDVNVAPFQDESSATGPPAPAPPHFLGASPFDPKKKAAAVPFLGREHCHGAGSGVVGDSDPDNRLPRTAPLVEDFRSFAGRSQLEEAMPPNKLFSAREEEDPGRRTTLFPETRVLSGDARVSPVDARVWSGDARVLPIDTKVSFSDARVWSGDSRVSSGEARVLSGNARVSSVGARVWSGDMHTNPPPSRQEGLLSRPLENTHNRPQPAILDIARELEQNREATGTSTGWDTRADRDRDREMDGKGRVAVAVAVAVGSGGGGVSHEKGNGGGGGGGTILMVGNLHWWTTDADLEGALSRFGHFRNLKFFEERASGKSRGYCQVEFLDPSAARACKEGLDGHPFDRRPCIVTHLNHHNLRQMASGVFDRSELKELGHVRRTGGGSDGNNNRGRSSLHGRGGGHGNRNQGSNMNNKLGGGGGRVRGGGSLRYGQGGQYAHQEQMGGVGGAFHHQYELAYGPSYGGFIARGPPPPSSGMGFPPYGLPAVAPHVNPAFLGRVPAMNDMNGNSGWIDPSTPPMTAWGPVEEIDPRIREGSYEDIGRVNYPFGGEMNKERNRGGIDPERERATEGEWGGGASRHEEEDSRDWAWGWEKQREHRDRDKDRDRDRGRDWDGEDYGRERTRTKYKVRGFDEDQRSSMSRDDDYSKRRRMS